MKIHMIRVLNDTHIRYYLIKYSPTLFGEIVFERIYGNVRFRAPTGHLKQYCETLDVAKKLFEVAIKKKKRKGYVEKSKDAVWM